MGKRSRSARIAVLAVTAVLALGCVPDPPPTEIPVPTTLAVAPAVVALHPGESLQLSAEVLDQNGEPMGSSPVAWSSDDDAVAEVSSAGLVTAITTGEATVTATAGALDATSEVTVTAVPNTAPELTITSVISDSDGLTAAAHIQVTVATCMVTPVLSPSSGTKDAGPLTLSAVNSSDSCGRPLAYGWDCVNTKNPQKCTDLRQSANNGDMVEYTFDIEVWEELAIQLRVCAKPINPPKCVTTVNYYTGASPIMG